jgi:hypothetical protein
VFSSRLSTDATNALTIVSPADGQNFQLTDADITSTTLQFLAKSSSTQAISWTAALQYQPSQGALGPYSDSRSFDSTTGTAVSQTYAGIGGNANNGEGKGLSNFPSNFHRHNNWQPGAGGDLTSS